jgi:hypothetical protein
MTPTKDLLSRLDNALKQPQEASVRMCLEGSRWLLSATVNCGREMAPDQIEIHWRLVK